ncbi:MAG: ABC transporter ATP-binding protein [Clostridium sp.]|nr:ABC transporter ATP-binding protein [Clostridium sp.]
MIQLKNITKTYNVGSSNAFEALHDITLTISDGEMIAIIGKSGAGKSTLLHIIGCIDHYDDGEYYLDDELIKNKKDSALAAIRNEKIGIVMQDYALIEDFTAIENVLLPLDFSKKKVSQPKKLAREALSAVGMAEMTDKPVKKLSGGQKQRVAIARALINHPKFLLADEPTGALDSHTSSEIMDLLKQLNNQGMTIIIITHDQTVANACTRQIEISDGNIIHSTAL